MKRIITSLALIIALLPSGLAAETRVPANLGEMQMSFAPVVERAAPAVVNIYAKRVVVREESTFLDDPFFQQFFGDLAPPRTREQNSLGSGVIVGGGLVVSNFHVVESATDIRVVLSDRREFDGTLVLADEEADLAVIRIEGGDDLPALEFADSDALLVGDLVLAIGNPFGVGQTVSSGIVSGLARSGRGGGVFNAGSYFIQTDAPINPGNSGGALVDMQGRLVGINTQIVTRSGGSNGIGFATPANLVARVVEQAAEGAASFTRPWAGIEVQSIEADIAEALGLERPQGVLLRALSEASPFGEAGLKPGDVILAIEGMEVNTPGELKFRLSLQELGREAEVTALRGGKRESFNVGMRAAAAVSETIGSEPVTITAAGPFQGLVVQEITPMVAARLNLSMDAEGVIVLGSENPQRARHFRPGDIITAINGTAIRSMADFNAVAEAGGRTWKIELNRRGGRVFLTWRG